MVAARTVLLLAVAALGFAQPAHWFPPAEMMSIGAYYYPEAWPESQWARDIANIKKLDLEFVHMGEFAWAFMEPEAGRFELDWLEKNVRLAAAQGLKVVLCTPSATPPVWLVRKHPEVLMVDERGRRMNHGSREHACWSVPLYRSYVAKIVTELAQRFGQDPAVWGWQIDNELSHYGRRYCYCHFCQEKFRAWLKARFGTVERLNRDWGNAFWSQMYQTFEQIEIPNQDELVQQVNPHAQLDFQRWFAQEAADFIQFQANLLRRHARKQWITTNYMAMHAEVDPSLSGRDLDIITWTTYPVDGRLYEDPLGFRLGDGAAMSFMHDFTRSINGSQGVMELQPGQVNWGQANTWPHPGAVRMWIMHALGAGSKLICVYRYRQPLYGGELYYKPLVEPDGVTPTMGGREFAQAMKDVRLLRTHYQPGRKEPPSYAARRTAFLYSFDNRWDIDHHKQTVRWDTLAHLLRYYKALKRLGAPVDVITEEKDFARHPFLVAPAYQLVDEKLAERWTAYARAGGHLILTCRTAHKDRRGQLWEAPWAGPINELIGAKIPFYDVLPPPVTGQVRVKEKEYAWGSWGEVLEPAPGVTVLARYADQFYAGRPAAVTRKLGKGTVTYIAVDTLDGDLERDLVRGVYQAAGVAVESFDNQFFMDWRDGFWVATNFSAKKQPVPLKPGAKLLIGEKELPPAGVAVWVE